MQRSDLPDGYYHVTGRATGGDLLYRCDLDHVEFRGQDPELMAPQTRECLGWLVYQSPDYVVVCFDRNADPPTLKGGDSKAGGLAILRSDLVKLEALR